MNRHFSYQEMRQIDLVAYLEKLGYQPQKIRDHDFWYLSPLIEENTASFKVNRKLNIWYDHGTGKGGNVVDFGILFHNCGYKEWLEKIQNIFSFHPQNSTVQQPQLTITKPFQEALEPTIKVIAAKPLTSPVLCRYLNERKIPLEIASQYCRQVDFEMHGKQYFAIGFQNNSGGFELLNEGFKASSSPKDITLINDSFSKEIAVFEGFFSFLSYLTIYPNKCLELTKFLVLNSLSFFQKSRALMEENQKINLYLDRDQAGIKNTELALQRDAKYIDRSHLYKNHKDLNEYLVSQNPKQSQGLRVGRNL